MNNLAAIAIIWALCGYVNYGLTLGYFTYRYPWSSNVGIACLFALLGPVGVPAPVLLATPYHWRTKPLSDEERYAAFEKEYNGMLGREYWERNYN